MYLLLGVGQALHSTGLYIAGFEGVARKVAGAAQDLDSATKIGAMVTEGVGGVIAVLGGIIFIFLAARLLLARSGGDVTASPLSSVRAGAE
jgi:heme/copper-type cytochrome/quinol oxidase subunit 1